MCAIGVIYSVVAYTSGTATPLPIVHDADVASGQRLFRENNCVACHQFYGLGGYMGPDLTNVISVEGKGSDYARVFIEFGTQKMPNFQFTQTEVDQLVKFLEFVDAHGKYTPENYNFSWYGAYEEKGQ